MRVYDQVAETIRAKIHSGEFPGGKALPSERKLAALLCVSRATVRSAIQVLTDENLIETRRGSGSYVSARFSESFSSLTSLSEEATARGMQSQFQWLSREVGLPTSEEAYHLGIAPTQQVSRIARLREANGEPLAIQTATIVQTALPNPNEISTSLYQTMAKYDKRPMRATQRIAAVAIVGEQAILLRTAEGAPGLQTWRVGYCATGQAVEYTQSLFRGDRWDFITELTLNEANL